MMSEALLLNAEAREQKGTGATRALRKRGMVPVTIYGQGKEAISIAIEEKEITKYYRKPQYMTQLFQFEVGGKKYKVLPKAVQLHPITDVVYHADFIFLEKEFQKMEVPIVYVNSQTSSGVKKGGYFNTVKRFLTLLCSVKNLPRKVEIDVTNMAIGTSIKAKQVNLPEGAKLLGDPGMIIASIVGRKGKSDSEAENAPAAGAK